ncbi:MAG: hypothetical protein RLZZ230_540 [Candidatus Parcubacteria bacterium]|jgi:hypothetical protein
MKSHWLNIVVAIICALMIVVVLVIYGQKKVSESTPVVVLNNVITFTECKNSGYPISETYPEECRTPDGVLFIQMIDEPAPDTVMSATSTTSEIQTVNFNSAVTLKDGDKVTFSDNLFISLSEINSSLCPSDVQCVWAGGQLSPLFLATGGEIGDEVKKVSLGTVVDSAIDVAGYTFTFQSATLDEAVLVVSENVVANPDKGEVGFLAGHVTVGPVCPVERVDKPCVVATEVYTSRNIVVFASDQNTFEKSLALDSAGNYKLTLPVGTYWLQIQPAGIGAGEMKEVTITSAYSQTVDFDIDTGIR